MKLSLERLYKAINHLYPGLILSIIIALLIGGVDWGWGLGVANLLGVGLGFYIAFIIMLIIVLLMIMAVVECERQED